MGTGPNLLRLLEPAVRPDGVNAPAHRTTGPFNQPIEQQSFEHLLEQAQTQATDETSDPTTIDEPASPPAAAPSPLGDLARVDRIENASLRNLFQDGAEGGDAASGS